MKQIYHNYLKWEDVGMWQSVPKDKGEELLIKAIDFTGDHKLYGSYMLKIIKEWPVSCEQNLTDNSINRRAWIGHAACFLALGCPEHITRQAWHYLTQEQQDKANAQADKAIVTWEQNQEKIKCPDQRNLWE